VLLDNELVATMMGHRLVLTFRRSARFVRVICVLSLAIASIVHVVSDFSANSGATGTGQTAVSTLSDDRGGEGGQAAEACHSCSVAPYFTAAPVLLIADASSEVPEGRLVQVSVASPNIAGPPPKN